MNFAEGRGPKQVKKPYVLGNFQTIYAYDGVGGGAATFSGNQYTAVQGSNTVSGQTWAGGIVGSVVPGLNINVNGNGTVDISFVCSPGANESVQDTQNAGYTLNTDPNFQGGPVTVWLQGTANRMWDNDDASSSHWVNITGASGTISGAMSSVSVSPTGTPWPIYNAYRLVASGATSSGIVNWAIAGMFTDFSAQRVGSNAADANGNIGQMSIQAPTNYTISGGNYTDNDATPSNVWEYAGPNAPYTAVKNDVDFYG